MNSKILQSISRSLLQTPQEITSLHIPRASVAAILRLVPEKDVEIKERLLNIKNRNNIPDLEGYINNQPWIDSADLQILFVKRSVNPRDVHSGNVALPGGKLDSGETPYDAVIRETSEEIGIDLSDASKFTYLGHMKEIDPYYASFRNKKMLLTVHLFLQYIPSTLHLKLNAAEIQSYRWTSFNMFTHSFVQIFHPISFSVSDSLIKEPRNSSESKLLRSFPGCILPPRPRIDRYNSIECPPDAVSKYHLWGITYRRIKELVFMLPNDLRNTSQCEWLYTEVLN